jgi:hypothetical protein
MRTELAAISERLDARASPAAYMAMGGLSVFFFIFGIWQATLPRGDWKITLVMSVAATLILLWVGTMRIQISAGQLSYRTLFTGTQSILLSDIESAETKVISYAKGSTMVLVLNLHERSAHKPMIIKIKMFSKEDVGRLFDLLGPKLKSARRVGIYSDESA